MLSAITKCSEYLEYRKPCSLNVIREYSPQEVKNPTVGSTMEKKCPDEKQNIKAEEKGNTSSESSLKRCPAKTTTRTVKPHPRRLTQRSVSSFDSSQMLRMSGSRDQRRCSNGNTHYLLEYRKRQRQMSIWNLTWLWNFNFRMVTIYITYCFIFLYLMFI